MAMALTITDLDLNITFKQALSMFHNILGGRLLLSLQQKETLRWPGAMRMTLPKRLVDVLGSRCNWAIWKLSRRWM